MGTLDRQQAARERGQRVLSALAISTPAAWCRWTASRGFLSLIDDGIDPSGVTERLLTQFPWPRMIQAARERVALVAGIAAGAVDAVLDARGDDERWRWLLDAVGHDEHALVAGWLLVSVRESGVRPPPVPPARLLSIASELAAPVAVLLHRSACTPAWLERAVDVAATLVSAMPRAPVAIAAPAEQWRRVLERTGASRSLARDGYVELTDSGDVVPPGSIARSHAEKLLYDALARDRRTAGRFVLNQRVDLDRSREIDLVATRPKIAVEIDGWHHFRDPENYRRDRSKDVALQQGGYLIMRYLAEDIANRVALVVEQIALAVAVREAGQRG